MEEFTPLQRVFGYGPDTFGIIHHHLQPNGDALCHGPDLRQRHNAYIHYFATIGPIGWAATWSSWREALPPWRSTGERGRRCLALFCAVLAYSAQAMVNIDLPIVTPFMWAFVAMGIACVRRSGE